MKVSILRAYWMNELEIGKEALALSVYIIFALGKAVDINGESSNLMGTCAPNGTRYSDRRFSKNLGERSLRFYSVSVRGREKVRPIGTLKYVNL